MRGLNYFVSVFKHVETHFFDILYIFFNYWLVLLKDYKNQMDSRLATLERAPL